jgi:hypothetical protein
VKLLTLSLLALSTFAAHASMEFHGSGTLKLNRKQQNIQVSCKMNGYNKDNFIKVGTDVYAIDGNCEKIEGRLEVMTNGRATINKNLLVTLNRDDLQSIVQNLGGIGLDPASLKDINCNATSNAFVIVADNLTNSMIGNCTTLR